MQWLYLSIAIVLPILIASTIYLVRQKGRKHRHRQKRNRRLINSILIPLSVPAKDDHKECTKSHDGHAPPTPAYKRFYLNTFFKIGRAVQQECRDRSRMPSSA
eukprot:TRINITY_DN9801_c0_g1_i1.p1 TRINITY_DN9801_c0_g1~~TRINITY_DN9801_c0_g1_i1.p1  ORF type:complete len:103 (+),score=13.58 TRINITY_DN9801_c0_g1_i1:49-357(+)